MDALQGEVRNCSRSGWVGVDARVREPQLPCPRVPNGSRRLSRALTSTSHVLARRVQTWSAPLCRRRRARSRALLSHYLCITTTCDDPYDPRHEPRPAPCTPPTASTPLRRPRTSAVHGHLRNSTKSKNCIAPLSDAWPRSRPSRSSTLPTTPRRCTAPTSSRSCASRARTLRSCSRRQKRDIPTIPARHRAPCRWRLEAHSAPLRLLSPQGAPRHQHRH